ncbi:MAG TPA: hypothetical protein VMU47_10470 [Caldimonas sp.]|nr:hypothetical protein [Caldimonas sp.]
MQGFSFGLLVDTAHEGPVAGATPRRRAGDPGWLAFGLRRLRGSLLNPWRRSAVADSADAAASRRSP